MPFFTPINGSRAERASARLILSIFNPLFSVIFQRIWLICYRRANATERLVLARALAASQAEVRLVMFFALGVLYGIADILKQAKTAAAATTASAAAGAAAGAADRAGPVVDAWTGVTVYN